MTTTQQQNNKNKINKNTIRKTILNSPIFQEFTIIRNIQPQTQETYATALAKYTQTQQITLDELIDEADQEEEQRIRQSRRKIQQRYTQFKQTLQEENYTNSTINRYIGHITTFYNTFHITTPQLPRNKTRKQTYKEIITTKDIQTVLEHAHNTKYKALILFMASSGTGRGETGNLTIQDFIDATKDYHHETKIEHVLTALHGREDIIPTWHIRRIKTDTPYFTFCTPEATKYILHYLSEQLLRKPLKAEDRLFGLTPESITETFKKFNDRSGFGWMNPTHRFFHSHGLRKFFATSMVSAGVSDMLVDFWEGRTIDPTHQAYFNPSPEQLKKRYSVAMDCVTILGDIRYTDITSEEKQELEELRRESVERERKIEWILETLNYKG